MRMKMCSVLLFTSILAIFTAIRVSLPNSCLRSVSDTLTVLTPLTAIIALSILGLVVTRCGLHHTAMQRFTAAYALTIACCVVLAAACLDGHWNTIEDTPMCRHTSVFYSGVVAVLAPMLVQMWFLDFPWLLFVMCATFSMNLYASYSLHEFDDPLSAFPVACATFSWFMVLHDRREQVVNRQAFVDALVSNANNLRSHVGTVNMVSVHKMLEMNDAEQSALGAHLLPVSSHVPFIEDPARRGSEHAPMSRTETRSRLGRRRGGLARSRARSTRTAGDPDADACLLPRSPASAGTLGISARGSDSTVARLSGANPEYTDSPVEIVRAGDDDDDPALLSAHSQAQRRRQAGAFRSLLRVFGEGRVEAQGVDAAAHQATNGLFIAPTACAVDSEQVLGAGSNAQVVVGMYGASRVAIKVLLGAVLSGDVSEFITEANTLSSLRHPNVVPFYGITKVQRGHIAVPCIITELCPLSLDRLLHRIWERRPSLSRDKRFGGLPTPGTRRGKFSDPRDVANADTCDALAQRWIAHGLARYLRAALEIAHGLAYLHGRGVLHMDLKPQNVLLSADGACKICDFGGAVQRHSAAPDGESAGGSQGRSRVFGTACYLAPELCTPDPTGTVSEQADIYSFGVLVAVMFADGVEPYQEHKRPQDIMDCVRRGERPSIAIAPFSVREVLKQCFSATPERRPSLRTIIATLAHALEREEAAHG